MPNPSGIILYDKKPGITSFSALGKIKKTLGTKKVGHTGTLDLFAQGLLVVCVGSLTRLAGLITAFDKEYIAQIIFGQRTDTLDPTGQVVQTAPLPTLDALKDSLQKFTGKIMQRPPEFSAIKIGGKRASDLTRAGQAAQIPARPVTVYQAELLEYEAAAQDSAGANEAASNDLGIASDCSQAQEGGRVQGLQTVFVKSARVRFLVSKGTYIRSLARDIGADCGSAARLQTLNRTRVGNFLLQDAVGEDTISASSLRPMDADTARLCGLAPATLRPGQEEYFWNGRPLRPGLFAQSLEQGTSAVFSADGTFMGAVFQEGGRARYEYVVPKSEVAK
ncbi:MAG: tRNA pseudouridine(55) synthase TruB [Treponema sp.]|nr:tRNA pseudouridine(55) synthase TruB [Treponema sp.]